MQQTAGLRMSRGLALVLAGLWLALAPVVAKGKLDYVEKFQAGKEELAVATFTDPDAAGAVKIVGLLGFASGDTRNSFAFKKDEWDKLVELWGKAASAQTSTSLGSWKFVGTMTETETTDVSQLTVSVGAGVKLAISSPNGASLSYVMPRADQPRFEKALLAVKQLLAR